MANNSSKWRVIKRLLLSNIILLGAILRFTNLNWDNGHMFHPDERNIAAAVSRVDFPYKLDPGFFAYNGFPIYLIDSGTQAMTYLTGNQSWLGSWGKINLVGRFWSALYSTASIIIIYKLGRFFSPTTGLIAAALLAFTPGLVQYAHYGVTESSLVFFVLSLALVSAKILKRSRHNPLDYVLLGILSGLSIGSKTTGISFLAIPATLFLLQIVQKKSLKPLKYAPYFMFFLLLLTFITTPFTFLNFDKFRESMTYEGGVVDGSLLVPYNLQFTGTLPYLHQLYNLHWQTSIFIPVLALIGLFYWLKNNHFKFFLPLVAFSVAYLIYIGNWHTKFIRYNLMLVPALVLLASISLTRLSRSNVGKLLLVVVLGFQIFWSFAHFSIYTKPQTRLVADKWINDHLPPKSTILVEHWDDHLPVINKGNYDIVETKPYDHDNQQKLTELSETLSKGDYLIISSRRLTGSIPRNPDKYPYTQYYYDNLNSGKLGYSLISSFSSYPELLGITIPDNATEETFQVYDHPTINIYQNKEKLAAQTILNRLYEK